MNVDVRRHHGHEDGIGATRHFRKRLRVHRCWCVDDQRRAVARNTQLPAARNGPGALEPSDAVHGRAVSPTFLEPAHARALRIEIHERGMVTCNGKIRGQIGRNRGLAGPAFRIQYDDSFHEQWQLSVAVSQLK